ncbi:MAG: triose-phosphate isomerase [Desulfotomaculaceae bacterium]|nr:triose-phosphate isomerase [Desulfotomaculaceae bacterium]MDD4766356.1 triose-phosphate isomerase [Desulfotomaculaceae bacterium]
MSRKPVIAGNWKMFKTVPDALTFVQDIRKTAVGTDHIEVVLCPPFTAVTLMSEGLRGSGIYLGAQDVFWEDKGAFTGEVSPVMLKDAGCGYVIIGHSERRQYFGETDEKVNQKVKAVLGHGLTPIMCVGETLDEREAGVTKKVVRIQTTSGLAGLAPEQAAGMVIAYEPVWAIGTGRTASDEDAQEVIAYIRGIIQEQFGAEAAGNVRILYGGSVKPENTTGLMSKSDIDGALVGGASLEVDSFTEIIKRTSETKR